MGLSCFNTHLILKSVIDIIDDDISMDIFGLHKGKDLQWTKQESVFLSLYYGVFSGLNVCAILRRRCWFLYL